MLSLIAFLAPVRMHQVRSRTQEWLSSHVSRAGNSIHKFAVTRTCCALNPGLSAAEGARVRQDYHTGCEAKI